MRAQLQLALVGIVFLGTSVIANAQPAGPIRVAPKGMRALVSKAYRCGLRAVNGSSGVTLKGGSFRMTVPNYRTVPLVEIPKNTTTWVEKIKATVSNDGTTQLHSANLRFSSPVKIKKDAVPFLKEMISRGAVKQSMISRLGIGIAGILNPKDIKVLELSFSSERGGQMKVGGKIKVMGVNLKLQPQTVSSEMLSNAISGDLTQRIVGMVGGKASCDLRATMSSNQVVGLKGQASASMDAQSRNLTLRGSTFKVNQGGRNIDVQGDLSASLSAAGQGQSRRVTVRTPGLRINGLSQRTVGVSGDLSAHVGGEQQNSHTRVETNLAVTGVGSSQRPVRVSGSAATNYNGQNRSLSLQQANLTVSGEGIGRNGSVGVQGSFTATAGEQGAQGRRVVVSNARAQLSGLTERAIGVNGQASAWVKAQQRSAKAKVDMTISGLRGNAGAVGVKGNVSGAYNAQDRSLSVSEMGVELRNALGGNRTLTVSGRLPSVKADLGRNAVTVNAAGVKIRNLRGAGDELGMSGKGSVSLKANKTVGFSTEQMSFTNLIPGKKVHLKNTSGNVGLSD